MNRSVRGGLLTLVAGAVLVTQTNAWGAVPAGTRDLTFGIHGTAALLTVNLRHKGEGTLRLEGIGPRRTSTP